MMAIKEAENGFVWKVQCQECEANVSASGLKSVPMAEDFITTHSEKTGHKLFEMDVLAHSICVKVIDCMEGEGNNG